MAFGFICPDLELKAKLTLFMYSQSMATFNFTEHVPSLNDFFNLGSWSKHVICLETAKDVNPINIVTTLAHKHQKELILIRNDPGWLQLKQSLNKFGNCFNRNLTEEINSQIMDISQITLNRLADVSAATNQPIDKQRLKDIQSTVLSEQLAKFNFLTV